ncbi:MAG: S8 family peptidase, partial [Hamadaea sp.]|nr:S8 family peptidase [Hamadaea sp.]
MRHRHVSLLGSAFAAAILSTAAVAPAAAAPAEAALAAVSGPVVADSYIAVLKPGADTARAGSLTGRHGAGLRTVFATGLRGCAVQGSAPAARRIAA